ncbi:MAG: OsmC family protein [Kiritimatiellia bacterium]
MAKTIEVTFPGGKKIDAKIGRHVIKTDQSVKNGGEESAPPPFDLFWASIATCAGINVWLFCEARKLSTDGMALTMNCSFNPEEKRYDKAKIDLKLPEGFPEKYRKAVVRAMNLCPVKKHIMNPPEFEVNAH